MSWGEPLWLWALLGVPLLVAVLVSSVWSRRKRLHAFTSPTLAPRIVTVAEDARPWLRAGLVVVAAIFVILALARPQWGASLEPIRTRGVDVILAVDVSRSMLAEDVRPSRLALARAAAAELADRLGGDRVGLLAFAGSAQTVCPLTLDRGALSLYLGLLSTDLIPRQGTVLADAVNAALEQFRRRGGERRILVLITDGESHDGDAVEAARHAAKENVIIYTVGIGTPTGQPIPLPEGGYKKDVQGNVVTSRLDEATLRAMAEVTGGTYAPATAAGDAIEQVAERISGQERGELTEQIRRRRKERYAWPLAIAGVMLLIEGAVVNTRRRNEQEVAS